MPTTPLNDEQRNTALGYLLASIRRDHPGYLTEVADVAGPEFVGTCALRVFADGDETSGQAHADLEMLATALRWAADAPGAPAEYVQRFDDIHDRIQFRLRAMEMFG